MIKKYIQHGKPPIGYKKKSDGTLKLDIEKAKIVQIIFDQIIDGNSISSIVSFLNKRNYTTRDGNQFTKQSVEDIAKNIIYTGTYVYNKENGKKKKTRLLLKDYPQMVRENDHPAIVSKEDFEQANAILNNRVYTRTNDRVYTYLLRGLMVCKHCGKKMVGGSQCGGAKKQIRHYYKCPNHKNKCSTKDINAEYIEKVIAKLVIDLIKKLNLNKELTVAIDEEIKELESTIARYEKQLARKKQELTGQTPLLTDSTVSDLIKDGIREIVEELLEDINNIKDKIIKIKDEIEGLKRIKLEEILDVESLLTIRHQGRDLINSFIEKIEVDGDEITIKLKKKYN